MTGVLSRAVVGRVLPAWLRRRYDRVNTTQGRDSVPLAIEGKTYYTTAEAAARLGVSHSAVRFAITNGTLESVEVNPRLNMVPEVSLEHYRRAHLGRRGRPKGSRNKAKTAPTESAAPRAGGGELMSQVPPLAAAGESGRPYDGVGGER